MDSLNLDDFLNDELDRMVSESEAKYGKASADDVKRMVAVICETHDVEATVDDETLEVEWYWEG